VKELRGRLLLDGALVAGRIGIDKGLIARIELEPNTRDADSLPVIAPGLVDLHIHGFAGSDPLDDLGGMARGLARHGTTAFQPTLFPRDPEALGADAERVWSAAQALAETPAARVVGLHLEGPFINPEAAGALPVADLAPASVAGLRKILGPATGDGRGIRTITLAPEIAGAGDLIRELVRAGVRVSLGHSRAKAAEARAAARAGAVGATHLFNAMSGLHHREAGLVGVALTESALFAEIIGDLTHVGADAFEVALAARGPEGLCLVSDALRGAGTGCDVFHWHGREHIVRDGTSYYPPAEPGGEPQLAGTACSQLEMVRKLVKAGIATVPEALTMASATPARALDLDGELGSIRVGARADLIALETPGLLLARSLVGGCDVI